MKKLSYGDKIYARLILNEKNVIEFVIDNIASMTELIGELRMMTRSLKGLAKLYVRNMTQGWCIERPFMIYPQRTNDQLSLINDGTYDQKPRMRHHWEEYF